MDTFSQRANRMPVLPKPVLRRARAEVKQSPVYLWDLYLEPGRRVFLAEFSLRFKFNHCFQYTPVAFRES